MLICFGSQALLLEHRIYVRGISMLTLIEETWPVVTIERSGPLQLAEMEAYIAAWERWLARSEPVGVLMLATEQETASTLHR